MREREYFTPEQKSEQRRYLEAGIELCKRLMADGEDLGFQLKLYEKQLLELIGNEVTTDDRS